MSKTLHPAKFILENEEKNLKATLDAFEYGNGWRAKRTVVLDDENNSFAEIAEEKNNKEFDGQWDALEQCGNWAQDLLDEADGWKVTFIMMDGMVNSDVISFRFKR